MGASQVMATLSQSLPTPQPSPRGRRHTERSRALFVKSGDQAVVMIYGQYQNRAIGLGFPRVGAQRLDALKTPGPSVTQAPSYCMASGPR
jgi:hypothetical protein